jgi:hypothetical protein
MIAGRFVEAFLKDQAHQSHLIAGMARSYSQIKAYV